MVATNCEASQVGDAVTALGGFSDHLIARDDLYTTHGPGERRPPHRS
ncbi:MAG: hypothetical protein IPH81_12895 [Candidatus Microthrix sp.]|nr:hypothetical protein [Candidatus Microthrix sp.]